MLNTLEGFSGGIALDASVLINLIATDYIAEILRSLSWPALAEDRVLGEVVRDPRNGGSTAPLIRELTEAGLLSRVSTSGVPPGLDVFTQLSGAPAPDDLGDGEAATIALAHTRNGIVATDDAKAARVCRQVFPTIAICTTVDIFRYDGVRKALGADRLYHAVAAALSVARMRVPFAYRAWVAELLVSA